MLNKIIINIQDLDMNLARISGYGIKEIVMAPSAFEAFRDELKVHVVYGNKVETKNEDIMIAGPSGYIKIVKGKSN